MGWMRFNFNFGIRVYPTIFSPTAGKIESMNTFLIDDSQV
jgi:hypothetical protein